MTGDLSLAAGTRTDHGAATVLLVEDEVLMLALVQEALEDAGYQVLVAETRPDAFEILESEPIDILVTDIRLRGGGGDDGWEIARHARELSSEVPVLYVTGYGAVDWPAEGVRGSRIVGKPFDPEQIVVEVADLLRGAAN